MGELRVLTFLENCDQPQTLAVLENFHDVQVLVQQHHIRQSASSNAAHLVVHSNAACGDLRNTAHSLSKGIPQETRFFIS